MICELVVCTHCLNEFNIEIASDKIHQTVCPYCKQWTDIEWKEEEE